MKRTIRTVSDLVHNTNGLIGRDTCFRRDEGGAEGGEGGSGGTNPKPADEGGDESEDPAPIEFKPTLDTDGNHIGEDGNILITKAELEEGYVIKDGEKFKPEESDTIDLLDLTTIKPADNGDLVDDEGNLILTKSELEQGYQVGVDGTIYDKDGQVVDVDPTNISNIMSTVGITIEDNEGKPVEYENSPEGISRYITDVYNKAKNEGIAEANSALEQMQEDHPYAFEAFNYMVQNGTLEGFANSEDYSKLSITKGDTNQHKSIVIKAEMLRGRSSDEAKEIADMFADNGNLEATAIKSLEYLKANQSAVDKQRADEIRVAELQEEQRRTQYWDSVKTMIDSGKLDRIQIPNVIEVRDEKGNIHRRSKEDFFKYVSMASDEYGRSAAQIAFDKLPIERKMEIHYMIFRNTGIGDTIAANTATQYTRQIKGKNSKRKFSVNTQGASRGSKSQTGIGNIIFE